MPHPYTILYIGNDSSPKIGEVAVRPMECVGIRLPALLPALDTRPRCCASAPSILEGESDASAGRRLHFTPPIL